MTLNTLINRLKSLGAKDSHVALIMRAACGIVPWPDVDDERLPKAVRGVLVETKRAFDSAVQPAVVERDEVTRSVKFVFALQDGHTIETVLLPRDGVCVSSQVGCAVGCVFCMTGRSGLIRQLTDLEIVSQVLEAKKLRPETKKVVFMGMGEPSHNLANVMSAIDFLGTYSAIGHKNLVLSTVGDKRVFEALETSRVKPALAISLHSTIEEKRRQLLPKAGKIAIEELVEKAEINARATGYPTQYQWTLIDGVNDGEDELANLVTLLKGHYAMVNFIGVNAVDNSPYRRPSEDKIKACVTALRKEGIAREIVNRIQNIRKNIGLEITDKIQVVISPNPKTDDAVAEYSDYIAHQVLAESIRIAEIPENERTDLNMEEFDNLCASIKRAETK